MAEIQISESPATTGGQQLDVDSYFGGSGSIDSDYFPVYTDNLTQLCEIASYWNDSDTSSAVKEANRYIENDAKSAIQDASNNMSSLSDEIKKYRECAEVSCKIIKKIIKIGDKDKQNATKLEKNLKIAWDPKRIKSMRDNNVPAGFVGDYDAGKGGASGSSGGDYDPAEDNGKLVKEAREAAQKRGIPQVLKDWEPIVKSTTSVGATEPIDHLGVRELGVMTMAFGLPGVLDTMLKYSNKIGVKNAVFQPFLRKTVIDSVRKLTPRLVEARNQARYIEGVYNNHDNDEGGKKHVVLNSFWSGLEVGDGEAKAREYRVSTATFDQLNDVMWGVAGYCVALLNTLAVSAKLKGGTSEIVSRIKKEKEQGKQSMKKQLAKNAMRLNADKIDISKKIRSDSIEEGSREYKYLEKMKKKNKKSDSEEEKFVPKTVLGGVQKNLFESKLNEDTKNLAKACIILLALKRPFKKKKSNPKGSDDNNKRKAKGAPLNDDAANPGDNDRELAFSGDDNAERELVFGENIDAERELVFGENIDAERELIFGENIDAERELTFGENAKSSPFMREAVVSREATAGTIINLLKATHLDNKIEIGAVPRGHSASVPSADLKTYNATKTKNRRELTNRSDLISEPPMFILPIKNLYYTPIFNGATVIYHPVLEAAYAPVPLIFPLNIPIFKFFDNLKQQFINAQNAVGMFSSRAARAAGRGDVKPRSYLDMYDQWGLVRSIATLAAFEVLDPFSDMDSLQDENRILYYRTYRLMNNWIRHENNTQYLEAREAEKSQGDGNEGYMDLVEDLFETNYDKLREYIVISLRELRRTSKVKKKDLENTEPELSDDEPQQIDDIDDSIKELDDIRKMLVNKKNRLFAQRKNNLISKALEGEASALPDIFGMGSENLPEVKTLYNLMVEMEHIEQPRRLFTGAYNMGNQRKSPMAFWN